MLVARRATTLQQRQLSPLQKKSTFINLPADICAHNFRDPAIKEPTLSSIVPPHPRIYTRSFLYSCSSPPPLFPPSRCPSLSGQRPVFHPPSPSAPPDTPTTRSLPASYSLCGYIFIFPQESSLLRGAFLTSKVLPASDASLLSVLLAWGVLGWFSEGLFLLGRCMEKVYVFQWWEVFWFWNGL